MSRKQSESPAAVQHLLERALIFHRNGQLTWALPLYQQVIDQQPRNFDALHLAGVIFAQTGEPEQAVKLFRQAVKVNANNADLYYNYGNALQQLKQYRTALNCYTRALRLNPDYADAHYMAGLAHYELQEFKSALRCFDHAIALNPDYAEAYSDRGMIKQNQGQLAAAMADYDQALAINPDYVSANWNKALLKLLIGDFEEGWQLYEWRWQTASFNAPLISNRPRWHPDCKAARLLIWIEQGVGDHIFFGGLFMEAAQWVEQLLVVVDARLLPLFVRSMPQIVFVSSDQPLVENQYDAHLPMGSLPGYLRNSPAGFLPNRQAYLFADQARAAQLRQQLAGANELLVGISWKSKNWKNGEKRSLDLNSFAALSSQGVKLVNLQYGEVDAEIAKLKAKTGVEVLQCASVDNKQDLDGLAALITACDLVVSCDNTTVHLAGSLGKPCWVLLPFVAEWRWLLERSDSPWYAATKLYRQETDGDWGQVMARVRADLDVIYLR